MKFSVYLNRCAFVMVTLFNRDIWCLSIIWQTSASNDSYPQDALGLLCPHTPKSSVFACTHLNNEVGTLLFSSVIIGVRVTVKISDWSQTQLLAHMSNGRFYFLQVVVYLCLSCRTINSWRYLVKVEWTSLLFEELVSDDINYAVRLRKKHTNQRSHVSTASLAS